MRNIKIFISIFIFFLYSQNLHSSMQASTPPRKHIITMERKFWLKPNHKISSSYHNDTLCSAYDQDIIHSAPKTTESYNDGQSLFNDPIIIKIDQLLKNPCTEQITKQVLKAIDPCIKTKTNQELFSYKLTIPQTFALNTLLEHVLRRCDNIISNPQFNLVQPHTNTEPLKQTIILRKFQDFPAQSTELFFLKFYTFFLKIQNDPCLFPNTFEKQKYLNTTEFDRFFESPTNLCEDDEKELREVKNPLRFYLGAGIRDLAKLADQLESKHKPQETTEEPILKKHRTET